MDSKKNTVVLYHANCPDGFGGAYAAWKKFGEEAEYIPLSHGDAPPFEIVQNKDIYFIDFCYPKEIMDQFVESSRKVVVLDHHKGVREVVQSMPEFVFDDARSGASIAWGYFHSSPKPKLFAHLEDGDLFQFALPETRILFTYIEVQPYDFLVWDTIVQKLNNPDERKELLDRAKIYNEYFERLAEISVEKAKLISFEGMEIYFSNAHPLLAMKSLVGNLLVRKKGPCALVVAAHPDGYGVSIRGDGTTDVSEIARKFGGNGHPNSAGFIIPREGPFPWTLIDDKK